MAYVSSEDFPKHFDVIVCGTGLTESILAAAFSRNGLSVLHIDPNQFYGGEWASLMHREFLDLFTSYENSEIRQIYIDSDPIYTPDAQICKLYENIELEIPNGNIELEIPNADIELEIPDADIELKIPNADIELEIPNADIELEIPNADSELEIPNADIELEIPNADIELEIPIADSKNSEKLIQHDLTEILKEPLVDNSSVQSYIKDVKATDASIQGIDEDIHSHTIDKVVESETSSQEHVASVQCDTNENVVANSTGKSEADTPFNSEESPATVEANVNRQLEKNEIEGNENNSTNQKNQENESSFTDNTSIATHDQQTASEVSQDVSTADVITQHKQEEPLLSKQPPSSWNDIKKYHRVFVFDIWPKLIYAADKFIDLLVRSGVTKYLEFKPVNKIMTIFNNELIDVPSSRADVFSTKSISMLEKRMLMKFVTFVMDLSSHGEEYAIYHDKPFQELLDHLGLNAKLQILIQSSIAQVDATATTQLAIERAGFYLQSIGKYSNSPYLWPMYGIGEMPQGFCRLSAVFGGIYMLRKDVKLIKLVDSESPSLQHCSSIMDNEGKEIYCKTLVMCASCLPHSLTTRRYSRAIIVIYGNLKCSQKQNMKVDIGLTTIPSYSINPEQIHTIEIIELAPGSNACSEGTYIIHFTCLSALNTAKDDLSSAVEYFLQKHRDESVQHKILISLYFNYTAHDAPVECKSNFATNIYLVSSPYMESSYQKVLDEAETIFKSVCPEDEFLPAPPKPEDIIYEMYETKPVNDTTTTDSTNITTSSEISEENTTHNTDNATSDAVISEDFITTDNMIPIEAQNGSADNTTDNLTDS